MQIPHLKKLAFLGILLFIGSALMPLFAESDEETNRDLYNAIKKNDIATLQAAFDKGTSVNSTYNEDTLLCWAIRENKPDVVNFLLSLPKLDINKNGTYIDSRSTDEWSRSAIIIAAHMGQADTVALLLKKGANINARDSINGANRSVGQSALMRAANRDHIDVAKVLFANPKKPDLELQDAQGFTALWKTADNEYLEFTQYLVSKGAKVNHPNAFGKSILSTTIMHKKFEVLDFLMKSGADINMVSNYGYTTLMWAVDSSKDGKPKIDFITHFLTYKPDLNFATSI